MIADKSIILLTLIFIVLLSMIMSNDEEPTESDMDFFPEVAVPYAFKLPNGLSLPRLGLGTAAMAGTCKKTVLAALNLGFQLIDTAQAPEWYDEAGVGEALQEYKAGPNPNDVVVVTKVHPRSFRDDKLEESIANSKLNLFNDPHIPLDVVLLHSPHCWQGHCTREEESHSWKSAWRKLESLKEEGHVLAIGVSNFEPHLFKELLSLADTKVGVIQNWMDPFNQDKEVRALAKKHEIWYMAYSSFGTQWEHKLGHNPVFTNPVLQSIADKHNSTIAHVVLSWLLQEEVIAIPRSTNTDHLNENALPMKSHWGMRNPNYLYVILDVDDMRAIRSLDGILGPL